MQSSTNNTNLLNRLFFIIFLPYLSFVSFLPMIISLLTEWLFFFYYLLKPLPSILIIFPKESCAVLLVAFVYWTFTWGVSVWRRTQYGRFTRGDRKLWVKGFASFWVFELVTISGLVLVACWMSWGPIVYIPRRFWFPKKGFIFELTIFTYIIWILYLMRFNVKWQTWKTQFFLTVFIVTMLSLLIWRDFLTIFFKEWVHPYNGTNWRFRKEIEVVYSLSFNWWIDCYVGLNRRNIASFYSPIEQILQLCKRKELSIHPFLRSNYISFKEYEVYNWIYMTTQSYWWDNIGYSLFSLNKNNHSYLYAITDPFLFSPKVTQNFENSINSYTSFFYPKKVGFLPKRIAMWFFLYFVKIWHHFMLFIWWFFYLLRLINRRKSSYTMLSMCHFNVYCCYIIGFWVYFYHELPFFHMFLKIKPGVQTRFQFTLLFNDIYEIISSLFFDGVFFNIFSKKSIEEISYLSYYKLIMLRFERGLWNWDVSYFKIPDNYSIKYLIDSRLIN